MKIGAQFSRYALAILEYYRLPASPAAVRLLVMIAAHESGGFRYVQQMNNGPAKGLLQMEPAGLDEVRRYMMLRPEKFREVPNPYGLSLEQLVFDTELALCYARAFLMAKPEALPDADDIEGLARYAKKYWNTEAGKATWEDYANAYLEYCQ